MSEKRKKITKKLSKVKKPSLKELKSKLSPDKNPLMENVVIPTKKGRVRTGINKDLMDPDTGEIQAVSTIMAIQEKDERGFIKVFSEGIKAATGLTQTGTKVFSAILHEYEKTKMNGGYAESIYLHWFDNGLCGVDVGMSERTFNRGLTELLELKFLAPKMPNIFWVNPSFFFKGDVVRFVREYKKVPNNDKPDNKNKENDQLQKQQQLKLE